MFEGRGMIHKDHWVDMGKSHERNQQNLRKIEDYGDNYNLDDPTDMYRVIQSKLPLYLLDLTFRQHS